MPSKPRPRPRRPVTGRNKLSEREKNIINTLVGHGVPIEDIAYAIDHNKETISAFLRKRRGRPKTYFTDENIATIKAMAGYGLSKETIAGALGISRQTMYKRAKEDERIDQAIEQGRAISEGQVSGALFNEAIRGNISAIIWYEKTRTGRTDKTDEIINAKVSAFIERFFELIKSRLDSDTYQRVLNSYLGQQDSQTAH